MAGSAFTDLPLMPTDYEGRRKEVHVSGLYTLTKFGKEGTPTNRNTTLVIPGFFAVLVYSGKSGRALAHHYFFPAGSLSTIFDGTRKCGGAQLLEAAVTLIDGGGVGNMAFTLIENEKLFPKPDFSKMPASDYSKEVDYIELYKKIANRRTANQVSLGLLNDDITRLTAEKNSLLQTEGRAEVLALETRVRTLYSLVFPNGRAIGIQAKLAELGTYRDATIDILPSLNDAVGGEHGTNADAIAALKRKIAELKGKIDAVDNTASTLRALQARYTELNNSYYQPLGVNSVVSKEQMENIRGQILEVQGEVRDFSSELELVGYLVSLEKDTEKDYNDAAANATGVDEYAQVRARLYLEKGLLRSRISMFYCDTASLQNELNRKKTAYEKGKAAKDYEANPGFPVRIHDSTICRRTKSFLQGWGGP